MQKGKKIKEKAQKIQSVAQEIIEEVKVNEVAEPRREAREVRSSGGCMEIETKM